MGGGYADAVETGTPPSMSRSPRSSAQGQRGCEHGLAITTRQSQRDILNGWKAAPLPTACRSFNMAKSRYSRGVAGCVAVMTSTRTARRHPVDRSREARVAASRSWRMKPVARASSWAAASGTFGDIGRLLRTMYRPQAQWTGPSGGVVFSRAISTGFRLALAPTAPNAASALAPRVQRPPIRVNYRFPELNHNTDEF